MKLSVVAGLAVLLTFISAANAQTGDSTGYGSKNTFSAFLEYSNNSSHIILGQSSDRKFTALGFQYEHRFLVNRNFVLRYAAEFRPLIFESDPTASIVETETSPLPILVFTSGPVPVLRCTHARNSFSFASPSTGILIAGTEQITCDRRWTYAQGLSPFGARINLLPRHRLQLTGSVLAGYILSAKKIPVDTAGSFNFTFEAGMGFEYFQSQSRSIRLEYQLQHFSNAYTADANPGVDSGVIKLTYNFGR